MKHSKANNTKKKKIRCEAPNQHCVRVRSETDMGVVLSRTKSLGSICDMHLLNKTRKVSPKQKI